MKQYRSQPASFGMKEKNETEKLNSEISHLLCRLKKTETNKDNEKRGRRESSKDFSWIRSIKMTLNEQVRVEGSVTEKKKIYAC